MCPSAVVSGNPKNIIVGVCYMVSRVRGIRERILFRARRAEAPGNNGNTTNEFISRLPAGEVKILSLLGTGRAAARNNTTLQGREIAGGTNMEMPALKPEYFSRCVPIWISNRLGNALFVADSLTFCLTPAVMVRICRESKSTIWYVYVSLGPLSV